jgi:hypothetical protein
MKLKLLPTSLRAANSFVGVFHRHHGKARGHKFSIAVGCDSGICGVAIIGRPVSKALDDGLTMEVTRVCTDGTRNACSFLYGAAWRAIKALGYHKGITYTLASESGASLRGAGWKPVARVKGRTWSRPKRARTDKHPLEDKVRWEIM